MSILGNIIDTIFGNKHEAAAQSSAAQSAKPTPASPTSASTATSAASTATSGAGQSPQSSPASAAPLRAVDVEAVLDKLASQHREKLNWRTSIVDLLKLLDMDSSLTARKQLAQELHYSGDQNDSTAMNTWLHREVMSKLAENGGKVPEQLKH